MLTREKNKLERSLGGIRDMQKVPSVIWVVDTNKEHLAVAEARKLNIPILAILDTNCDPDLVDYPIPGNDDAMRAIQLYCDLVSGSVLDGLQAELAASGVDVGARAEIPSVTLPEDLPEEIPGEVEVEGVLDSVPSEAEAAVVDGA